MAKLTTEEFIAKAKAVHGDRYAYSKVKYVDNKTKVCIICKIHGEFMQPPSMHMRGHGCAKCSTERNTEKLMLWTREKCYEEAQKCNSRSEFKRSCPYGYSSARKHGWLDDYTWFAPARKQVPAGYWTYERCYVEAKKCNNLKEFMRNANGAYQKAKREGWLDGYTWFKPLTGFWTYEACKAEAAKYERRGQFKAGCIGAYTKSRINGWLDEFFPNKK